MLGTVWFDQKPGLERVRETSRPLCARQMSSPGDHQSHDDDDSYVFVDDDDGDDDNNDDNNDDDKFPPVYCVGIALQHCIKLLLSN